ncbi:hypothetical protein GCM10027294_47940 [Marinactinospora endophytica]
MNGVFSRGALYGLLAGAAGTLVMTLGERLEQRFTGRPDSQVPARTLERLTGRPEPSRGTGPAMHVGQGVLLGTVRGVMSCAGLRGPWASAMFGVVRLTSDQILENATGVGAPPGPGRAGNSPSTSPTRRSTPSPPVWSATCWPPATVPAPVCGTPNCFPGGTRTSGRSPGPGGLREADPSPVTPATVG